MDAIVAQTQRSRQRSRQTTGVTAHDPINNNWIVRVAGGSETLFVDEVEFPQSVNVGDPIDVRVQVVNAAVSIGPGDPDQCTENVARSGYRYDVTVSVEGAGEQTRQKCLESLLETDHNFDFEAPSEPGTYTLDITVEGSNSGYSGGGQYEIEVVGEDEQSDRDDGDNTEGGDNGDNVIGGGDDDGGLPDFGLGPTDYAAIGGGLALLLVVLIALR